MSVRSGRFEGKTALVTGGARGQGAEDARRLVEEGARVVVTDVLDDEGENLARALGYGALFVHHDVADEDGWRRVVERVVDFGGGLDCLVNNAGIIQLGGVADTTREVFERHQRINELGVFLGMKVAAPLMVKAGGGAIVNVSSIRGMRANGGDVAYVSSKWAVRGMTKSAALEYAAHGIRINSIHPGVILTPLLSALSASALEERAAKIPMKRIGTVQEVADLVLFLLSDEARYITGAEIAIDGGMSL
jgi:3alpha(or 20beta)-hydroxysteroid dehydrogenase